MKTNLLCLLLILSATNALADTFYVSPEGLDTNAGSITAPWKMIKTSARKLKPGDTMYLRRGTYFESSIDLSGLGTQAAPVQILGYPNEEAIVDGGFLEFRTIGNSDWELCTDVCDPAKNIYRSVKTFASAAQVGGYFDWNGVSYRLIPYKSTVTPVSAPLCDGRTLSGLDYLASDNHDYDVCRPRYVGPGLFLNESDNKIYIRMVQPAASATFKTFDLYTDLDPRKLSINLGPYNFGFHSNTGASYARLSAIKVYNHLFSITGQFNYSTFDHLDVRPNLIGFNLHPSSSYSKIDHVSLDGFLPPWLAWLDVKAGEQPMIRIRVAGITNAGHHIEITNNTVKNFFDGMLMTASSSHDIKVWNNQFSGMWDDVVQLAARTYNIDFGYNVILGAGPSHDGDASSYDADYESKIGTKYFHHNVFDNTKKILWGRNDPKGLRVIMDGPKGQDQIGWKSSPVFSSHLGKGYIFGDPWKIYNNTFILSDPYAADPGLMLWGNVSTKNIPHEVYNNIFSMTDSSALFVNSAAMTANEIHDGNLYFTGKNNVAKTATYANLKNSDTHLEVANDPAFNFGATRDFSIGTWVRMETVVPAIGGLRILFADKRSTGKGYTFGVYSVGAHVGKPYASLEGGGHAASAIGYDRIDDGNWHYLVLVVDRTATNTFRIYIDGALKSTPLSLSLIGDMDSVASNLLIGTTLNGALDQMQVYHRALKANEIRDAYTNPQLINTTAQWDLSSAIASNSVIVGLFPPLITTGPVSSLAYGFSGFTGLSKFAGFSDFLASSLREKTKTFYPPGWEAQGIEADPMLNSSYEPDAQGPAATGGIDLTQRGWPAASETKHRGAKPPSVWRGLAGAWKLDEAAQANVTANLYESSNNGLNAYTVGVVASTPGLLNGALRFDGTSYARFTSTVTPNVAFNDGSFTVSIWMKPENIQTNFGALAMDGSSLLSLFFGIGGNIKISSRNNAAQNLTIVSSTKVVQDVWNHIVIVRDAQTQSLNVYLNGYLVNSLNDTRVGGFTFTTTSMFLGRAGSFYLKGSLDEFALWGRAVSSEEVNKLYLNGIGL